MITDRDRFDFMNQKCDVFNVEGMINEESHYEFNFVQDQNIDSYSGLDVCLRYFIRFTIERSLAPNIVKEMEIWIINHSPIPTINPSIKMEVGVEDCILVEYEFTQSKYHLKDVIIGNVYFVLLRIKLKYMELSLTRREMTGTFPDYKSNSETIIKYEIMDGCPTAGINCPCK